MFLSHGDEGSRLNFSGLIMTILSVYHPGTRKRHRWGSCLTGIMTTLSGTIISGR